MNVYIYITIILYMCTMSQFVQKC